MRGWKLFASTITIFPRTQCVKNCFPRSSFLLGFYGRPWTMEQRKELFRRYRFLIIANTITHVLNNYSVWKLTHVNPLSRLPDSRNGDWTRICMRRKMTTNIECSGERCTLWRKQVKSIVGLYCVWCAVKLVDGYDFFICPLKNNWWRW